MNINLSLAIDAYNDSSNVDGANDYVNMLASNGYFSLITVVSEHLVVLVELLLLWWLTFWHSVRKLFQINFSLLFLTNAGNMLSLNQWYCMTHIHFDACI